MQASARPADESRLFTSAMKFNEDNAVLKVPRAPALLAPALIDCSIIFNGHMGGFYRTYFFYIRVEKERDSRVWCAFEQWQNPGLKSSIVSLNYILSE